MLTIRWFGISCFEIRNSATVVIDPHDGESIGLDKPDAKGDLVLVTHQHFDHASGKKLVLKEGTKIIEESGKHRAKGIEVEGITYYREDAGRNVFFNFELEGFKICHLGDLGYSLSIEEAEKIRPADILLLPVGGTEGREGREAAKVLDQLEPSVVIPHHYMVKGMSVSISSAEEFLRLAKDKGWKIEEMEETRIESLPEERKIIKLECLA